MSLLDNEIDLATNDSLVITQWITAHSMVNEDNISIKNNIVDINGYIRWMSFTESFTNNGMFEWGNIKRLEFFKPSFIEPNESPKSVENIPDFESKRVEMNILYLLNTHQFPDDFLQKFFTPEDSLDDILNKWKEHKSDYPSSMWWYWQSLNPRDFSYNIFSNDFSSTMNVFKI